MLRSLVQLASTVLLLLTSSACMLVGPNRPADGEPDFDVLTEQIELAVGEWSSGADPRSWNELVNDRWDQLDDSMAWDRAWGGMAGSDEGESEDDLDRSVTWPEIVALLYARRSVSRVEHKKYYPITNAGHMGGPLLIVTGAALDVVVFPIWSGVTGVRHLRVDEAELIQGAIDIAIARRLGYRSSRVQERVMLYRAPFYLDVIGYDEAWLTERAVEIPQLEWPESVVPYLDEPIDILR